MGFVEFEWDDTKAESNFKKHGIRFSEAVTIWLDDSALEMPNPDPSHSEDRWIRGTIAKRTCPGVVYVEKIEGERIRIISARKATHSEIEQYNSR